MKRVTNNLKRKKLKGVVTSISKIDKKKSKNKKFTPDEVTWGGYYLQALHTIF